MYTKKHILNSVPIKSKPFYAAGIASTLIFGFGHLAYAFFQYKRLDEQALWFSSGGLAVLFNAGLNMLCLYECTRLNYTVAMIANYVLALFSISLVIEETQTIFFSLVVFYTTVTCYANNRNTH